MNAGNDSQSDDSRFAALDGVRALAVLLVIQFHVIFTAESLLRERELAAFDRVFLDVWSGGWAGVDLFFVLSGFLITGILLRAKAGPNYFRSFYARRFLRIFPLYYGFLAFLIFVYPNVRDLDTVHRSILHIGSGEQFWYWTYTQNIGMAFPALTHHDGLPASYLWSLAVEEQFYLLWPFIVLLLPRRGLIAACVLLLVAALALRIFMTYSENSWFSYRFVTYFLLPTRMDTLAAGALIACLLHTPARANLSRIPALVAGGIGLAVIIVLGAWQGGLDPNDDWVRTIGFSALVAFFAGALYIVATARKGTLLVRSLSGQTLTSVGAYSYAIYLFHPIITLEMADRIFRQGGLPKIAGSYVPSIVFLDLIVIATSFSAAWLSWHAYEKHFLNLKRFFPYGRPPAVMPPALPGPNATGPAIVLEPEP